MKTTRTGTQKSKVVDAIQQFAERRHPRSSFRVTDLNVDGITASQATKILSALYREGKLFRTANGTYRKSKYLAAA